MTRLGLQGSFSGKRVDEVSPIYRSSITTRHPPPVTNRGVVINPKLLLFSTLRIAYFVLCKGATQYAVRNTQYETLFQGQEAFEL